MKYTLEIQKLLLQAQNDNLHPREKANLLREAIRIAFRLMLKKLLCFLKSWTVMKIIRTR